MGNFINKIGSAAHQEFNMPTFKDMDYISSQIYSRRDIIMPVAKHCLQEIDEQFPSH